MFKNVLLNTDFQTVLTSDVCAESNTIVPLIGNIFSFALPFLLSLILLSKIYAPDTLKECNGSLVKLNLLARANECLLMLLTLKN